MRLAVACVALASILTACAAPTSRMGIYAAKGQDAVQQAHDAGECSTIAMNAAGPIGPEAATGGVVGLTLGAAIGAGLGALVGAFLGVPGEGAAIGAALGGATGGLQGAAGGAATNRDVTAANYAACMRARGYEVAR